MRGNNKTSERNIPLLLAIIFYGFLTIAGCIWLYFTSNKDVINYFNLKNTVAIFGLGIGCGIAIVLISILAVNLFGWARKLKEEFGLMIGGQKKWQIPILAIISGIGEEVFFRGAVQYHLGLLPTSIIFGLVHFPINRRFIAWPIFAILIGLLLGWQYIYTKSLVTPIITHSLINFFNLWKICGKYSKIVVIQNEL